MRCCSDGLTYAKTDVLSLFSATTEASFLILRKKKPSAFPNGVVCATPGKSGRYDGIRSFESRRLKAHFITSTSLYMTNRGAGNTIGDLAVSSPSSV